MEDIMTEQRTASIGMEQLRTAQGLLEKYRSGKANLDAKIIEAEDWWKMNHYMDFKRVRYSKDPKTGKIAVLSDGLPVKRQSSWMFNSIMNKHADLMDNFPDPVIMARSKDDEEVATMLSDVVPVVLDRCGFEKVYSDNSWDKLTQGTAIYAVTWDKDALNGLGDISVRPVDMLSIYWEPGIQDIQESQNIFLLSLEDKSLLEDQYPQTRGRLTGSAINEKHYNYDDQVDTTDKSVVVDWYYKRAVQMEDGRVRTILHFCKFVDDIVLYSSEDDPDHPEYREMGFYNHGKYPFVVDALYRVKGTPAGYGFVDIMRGAQEDIDALSADFKANAKWGARPRYFAKNDIGINLEEFRNLDQQIVHVGARLDQDSLRLVETKPLDGNYINVYQMKIDELKETSGNRDFSQGSTSGGVTSGSAIAALQEAGSKGSRDMIKGSYRAFSLVCELVVELIRQFYTTPRTFRITGPQGPTYVTFDNSGMLGAPVSIAGQDFAAKEPVFDIVVKAQKANPYSRLSQNELALQFYNLGFFNPQFADQALATVDMMDFDGKEKVIERIQKNSATYQTMMQMAQLLSGLTGDTRIADALMMQAGGQPAGGTAQLTQTDAMGEPITGNSQAAQSRRRAAANTEAR